MKTYAAIRLKYIIWKKKPTVRSHPVFWMTNGSAKYDISTELRSMSIAIICGIVLSVLKTEWCSVKLG